MTARGETKATDSANELLEEEHTDAERILAALSQRAGR